MRIRVALILDTLHALALSLWLGAAVMLVWVILPGAALVTIKDTGGPYIYTQIAVFTGRLVEICGLIMVGIQFLLRRRYLHSRTHFVTDGTRQLLTFGAFFLAEYTRYILHPVMLREGSGAALSQHVTLTIFQIVLLVAVTGISAWLMLPPPRTAVKPVAEPSPSKPASGMIRKSSK